MIFLTFFSVLCLILAVYAGLFTLWSVFEREHVDETDVFIDRLCVAVLISVYAAKLPGFVFALFSAPFSLASFFNPFVGTYSWQVGSTVCLLTLFLLLRDRWKDRFALFDLNVVALSLFLSITFVGKAISTGIGAITSGELTGIIAVIRFALCGVAFFGLSRLLQFFERKYRTFFWYRHRRSSAQTGFVTAVFCIAFGLIGMLDSIFQYPFSLISPTMFTLLWSLFCTVSGFVLIYVRSGRLKR